MDLMRVVGALHPDWSGGQVREELERRCQKAGLGGAPDVRTVQRYLAANPTLNPDDLWSIVQEGPPEDAAIVMSVLPAFRSLRMQEGPYDSQPSPTLSLALRTPTKSQARLIVLIQRTCPDLPPREVAWLSILGSIGQQGTRYLEDYLAYAPWRDEGHQWRGACKVGLVDVATVDFAEMALLFYRVPEWLEDVPAREREYSAKLREGEPTD